MVERVADRPVDLRHAAQRVRVLDLVRRRVVAALELAPAEDVAELGRDRDLSRMGSRQLIGGGVGDVRPEQGLDAHRRDHRGGPRQAVGIGEQQRPDRAHQLRPVEERQALLGLELHRLESHLAEGQQRRHDRPAELDGTLADDRQREVRERREVPGRADAALLRHDRVDTRARGTPAAGRPARAGSRCGRARACWRAAAAWPARSRAGTARRHRRRGS